MISFPFIKPGDTLLTENLTYDNEMCNRRTLRGKTFVIEGNKRVFRLGTHPVHFANGGKWQDIDLSVRDENKKIICDGAGYSVTFDPVVPHVSVISKHGETELVLERVGASRNVASQKCSIIGNEVVYDYGDYSIHAEVRPQQVEFFKLLKTSAAPREFEWRVVKEKRAVRFNRKSAGRDAGKHNLEMVTEEQGDYFTERWTGNVGKIIDLKTRKKKWSTEAEYPIVIDGLVSIGSTSMQQHVWEKIVGTSHVVSGSYNNKFGVLNLSAFNTGFSFSDVLIPRGAKIVSAKIVCAQMQGPGTGINCKMYGGLAAGDGPFGTAYYPSAISKSVYKFTLPSTVPVWHGSLPSWSGFLNLDATDIVQSIINQTHWASGHDMRFAILNQHATGTAEGYQFCSIIDYPEFPAPVLEITYLEGSGHLFGDRTGGKF